MHLATIIKSVCLLCQRFSLIQAAQYCVFLLCIFSICCRFSVSAAQYSSFLSRPQGADRRQPPSGGCLCIFIHFCICYLSPAAPCAAGPTAPDAADNRRKTASPCPSSDRAGRCSAQRDRQAGAKLEQSVEPVKEQEVDQRINRRPDHHPHHLFFEISARDAHV